MASLVELSDNEYDEVVVDDGPINDDGVEEPEVDDSVEEPEVDDGVEEPKVGMTFSSEEEVWSYYIKYAKQKGFRVSRRNSRQSDDGSSDSDDVEMMPSHTCVEGKDVDDAHIEDVVNVEDEVRVDVDVNVEDGGRVDDGVNLISSSSSGLLEPFIGMEFDDVEDAQAFYKAYVRRNGFAIRTNHTRLSKEEKKLIAVDYVCSREGFRRERSKHVERTILETAETKIGCKAIMGIKKESEKWIVDENGCMGSCFWADARSRAAYQYFGDVVTFDVTYLTNLYKMPFVPFSGVNHHHQTIMFGCALLVNETAESYVWLLRTWQEAMLGRAPSTIITDDDKAMAKAIVEVLPNTTHRLCLWHILQKFSEHLAHVYNRFPEFGKDFRHCIHETITIKEFEQAWSFILVKYALGDNAWLQGLYNRREKWVSAYLHSTFCAGMSTTQRSESMNKFFKDYVRSSTMVSDFVYQYEKALDARYFKEKEKDVRTKSTRAILKTGYKIEEEATIVYTRKSFMVFQEELFNSQQYKSTKCRSDCESKTYGVTLQGKETPIYYVTLESGQENATCTCHMFEFVGILWHVMAPDNPAMIKSKLIMQFYDVAELASKSPRKLNHLSLALEKVTKELELMDLVHVDIEEATGLGGGESINSKNVVRSQIVSNFSQTLQDPPRVPTKGRPPKGAQNLDIAHTPEVCCDVLVEKARMKILWITFATDSIQWLA
ncbi:protein FAR1-RELATED SEQUENCE 5-like [Carya illinoinensis]|uniref:protein FAR1-RELATED SEQUENCE 5-like n=1 Tax=Carya illinoinensis TaxID=32201 RepID=UPI001C725B4D|nr:protein FAR1-RELATED SEQUENCE 5-like [Carya illinoinensis]